MPSEVALLESRTLRADHAGRVDVLEKVRALRLLPDGLHVTTEGVAEYFAVHKDAVHSVVRRHREELIANGMTTLTGDELRIDDVVKTTTSSGSPAESYPQGRSHLRVFTRRAVLNIAMLLRDSEVARCVRTYLLDTEEAPRTVIASDPRYDGLEHRVTDLEGSMARIGPALQELGPVLRRMSMRLESLDLRMETMDRRLEAVDVRLDGVDRRLDATNRVVGAMSVRLTDLSEDVADIQRRLPRPPDPRRRRRR
ncbi:hypothetical protein GCM10010331_52720 [Streptomyces xanthochromogenes]|uniref:hypothetical protein n=1 Tax=Streptomyces xanthochromogenes TaxID=67384 RepID=UPI00167BC2A0|nr:hypothetical protein [Streptomyces xanthochromogenes]GHB58458.1 hypothetical protein GCM10010331_52720 [Streptomyces xanthochromogenes]